MQKKKGGNASSVVNFLYPDFLMMTTMTTMITSTFVFIYFIYLRYFPTRDRPDADELLNCVRRLMRQNSPGNLYLLLLERAPGGPPLSVTPHRRHSSQYPLPPNTPKRLNPPPYPLHPPTSTPPPSPSTPPVPCRHPPLLDPLPLFCAPHTHTHTHTRTHTHAHTRTQTHAHTHTFRRCSLPPLFPGSQTWRL